MYCGGKRFKQATMMRKQVPVGHRQLERTKRIKPLPYRNSPPQQIPKSEEKIAKVPTPHKKPVKRQPSLEPSADGHYELNPLMTRMVDKELEDIMIKVWQKLPENPSQNPDNMGVDKFKNEAGEDLRNVLGLNVTKRLLNVHNPLYVKVQFTKRPERDHLKAFLLKYRCIKFERVDTAAKTFHALMKNIQDFDKICSVKTIRIGNIKAYISPKYEFFKCPPNLKTNFKDKRDHCKDKIEAKIPSKESQQKNISNIEKLNDKSSIEEKVEVKSKLEVKEKVEEPKKPVQINTATPVAKPAVTPNKQTEIKPKTENISPKTTTNTKPIELDKPKEQQAKIIEESKQMKPVIAIKSEDNKATKPVVKTITKSDQKPINKDTVQAITKTEETKTKAIVNVNKLVDVKATTKQVPNKVVKKPENIAKKPVQKTVNPPKVVKKPNVPNKTQKDGGKVKNKNKFKSETMRILEEGDDYDVLDDDDILALISEGVILDECSGSDND